MHCSSILAFTFFIFSDTEYLLYMYWVINNFIHILLLLSLFILQCSTLLTDDRKSIRAWKTTL